MTRRDVWIRYGASARRSRPPPRRPPRAVSGGPEAPAGPEFATRTRGARRRGRHGAKHEVGRCQMRRDSRDKGEARGSARGERPEDTGCHAERPRRPVALTLTLIAHARATGGGPECPVDFDPRYCYANSNEMSSGALVLATCPPPLPHPECGLQDTVGICLKGSRPASSLAGCAADGFGFLPQHLFRTLVPQAVVRVFSRFLLLRLAQLSAPLPHPECGLRMTCISISTGLESSRPTSSLTGSGNDGHRNNNEQREREQPGRFGACWSAGLAGVV